MSNNTSILMSMPLRAEVAFGYLLQIVSVLLLLAQHFLLPLYLGLQSYGLLAFTIGWASLLFCTYDHGYNLLTVRKPSLGLRYLANKLAILSLGALAFFIYVCLGQTVQVAIVIPVLLHAFSFVVYTYLVNYDIATGQIKRVVVFSLLNGGLLLLAPMAFASTGINITYAPAVATLLSLVVIVAARGNGSKSQVVRGLLLTLPRLGHVRKSFIKQAQISFGTIMDGTIVWLGVVVVASLDGFESAAIYRLVMSAIALLAQVIPLPKQVLLRMARTGASFSWSNRFLAVLVLVGAAQVLVVYLIGRQTVSILFPETANAIYAGVLLLSPIAALKAILDLETVLYDRANRLSRLPWNALIAGVFTVAVFVKLDIYWTILVFYVVLTALSASSFLAKWTAVPSKVA